ncbi:MAG: hypothetical protein GF399_00675 [Candidatus Coatesbacteria bacterium]|nr:hypothetical protein [Candidatus Coatesbacteria bacterium]
MKLRAVLLALLTLLAAAYAFRVDNNEPPSIVLTDITEEQTADVTIQYEISDREGDPISLKPEFSRDGGATWEPATVTGQTAEIGPAGYVSTLTWNSKQDVDMLDLFEVQFKLTPSDNDEGTADATSNFQVDNSDIPSIVLTDITEEQTADVTIQYEISDREGDPISLKPEFSRDGGATWEPATVTGQTAEIGPAGYVSTLTWNSKQDVDMLDGEYVFRITPADNDTGEPAATGPFQVDNSDVPTISLTTPTGEQSGDVEIAYDLQDRENDPITLTPEFSADGGASWRPATVTGQTESVTPGPGSLTWNSKQDVDMLDGEYVFRITPADNDTGEPAATGPFQVDNSDVPTISLQPISEEQSAEVEVAYELSDRENDPITLSVEYSTDGAIWNPADVSGRLEGVTPGPGSLTWNSTTDLDARDLPAVYLRVTPADNDTGEPAQTGPFPLDNSEAPRIELQTPSGEQSGAVEIGYTISDREDDPVSLEVSYSLDGGSSWDPATIAGSLEGLTPDPGAFTWQSDTDAPGVDENAVMISALPSDNDQGQEGLTGIFMLDNNQPPSAELSLPAGTLSGIVQVTVTPLDPEGDPVDCGLEYDAGTGWTPASISGGLSGLTGPTTVSWDTVMDLGETAASGTLRVIPADNDTGEPGTVPFSVDNTPAPPPEPEPEPEPQPEDETSPGAP